MQSLCAFLDVVKFGDLRQKNCWCQQNYKGVSRDSDIFWIFSR